MRIQLQSSCDTRGFNESLEYVNFQARINTRPLLCRINLCLKLRMPWIKKVSGSVSNKFWKGKFHWENAKHRGRREKIRSRAEINVSEPRNFLIVVFISFSFFRILTNVYNKHRFTEFLFPDFPPSTKGKLVSMNRCPRGLTKKSINQGGSANL